MGRFFEITRALVVEGFDQSINRVMLGVVVKVEDTIRERQYSPRVRIVWSGFPRR
ncbi:hypothetical protein [Roseovarius sp. EL26]|uniref:hypothetical protein n=1 Tax=Roseovarius sp. EL26 TaxID=2126672 RepID=UPI0013C431B8|nr:hypothetical protein [Roseovarius sp. EL26]